MKINHYVLAVILYMIGFAAWSYCAVVALNVHHWNKWIFLVYVPVLIVCLIGGISNIIAVLKEKSP